MYLELVNETIGFLRVMFDEFGECWEHRVLGDKHASRVFADSVVEDLALEAHRNRILARVALALADQEAAVDAVTEGVFCSVARNLLI